MEDIKTRIESDSIGEKEVPADAYYGVQSLRGKENFHITGRHIHPEMIVALAEIKKACAITNQQSRLMSKEKEEAIAKACDLIIEGKYHDQFICDAIQGGAGTTANMNANEVIANLANEIMGGELGTYNHVHPNDDVNMCQSTNDVYPTAGKIAAVKLVNKTIDQLMDLINALEKKSIEFDDVIKMGRTQLQDAVPIRLGQEFHAYQSALRRDVRRIKKARDVIKVINMGSTAIGTGINVDVNYYVNITETLARVTGLSLKQADDMIDGTQNLDGVAHLSATIKTCAITLSKMSNDLRLMSSGPRTGLGEIILPARQNGSSIMPGKVNPVIPEVASQVAFSIIGNDMCITMAAEAGQLELNAFEPVMFYKLFESIETLGNACETLRVNCIEGIVADKERCKALLDNSVGMVTALVPHIGYKKSAAIAKEALKTGESVTSIILRDNILDQKEIDEIFNPFQLTKPGIAARELIQEKGDFEDEE